MRAAAFVPAALLGVTGACALSYEVLWAKRLSVLLGGTSEAHAAVLALFLGGLALGSALLGRLADRVRSPLALYGALELAAAALAAVSPWVLELGMGLSASGRWAVAVAALAPAILLMGGSLPALTRFTAGTLDELTGAVSGLAAANAAGAAFGALAAGFWLTPTFGIAGGLRVAAAVNAAAALAVLLLARSAPRARPLVKTAPAGPLPRIPLLAAALAGCVTILLETAWIRLFALGLGSTVNAFSLMTAAFIIGISAGAFAVERGWLSGRPPRDAFAFCQLGGIAAVLVGLPVYARLPYLAFSTGNVVPQSPAYYPAFEAARFLLCLAAAGPAAFFAGAAMPFAARAAAEDAGGVGRAVGAAYGANAAGNAAGAALGLWLLPPLGLSGLLALAGLGSAAAGAVLSEPARRRRFALAALAVLAAPFFGLLEPRLLSSGTFRRTFPKGISWTEFKKAVLSEGLLYHLDDSNGTVVVVQARGHRYLKVNGKTDASDGDDMKTQVLLAAIPLTQKPAMKDVLLVGLGSGVTASAALTRPQTDVTVVEISRGVVEASGFFGKVAGMPLTNARARLFLGDAGAFLRTTGPSYDLVISEPSNPWMAGVASLFTEDFYGAVRKRLRPGGTMAQWFHLYEMSDEAFRLVLRTFAASFPIVEAWDLGGGDVLLLGSDVLIPAEPPALGEARRVLDDAAFRREAGTGPLHTDDRPLLETLAGKALFLDDAARLSVPLP